MKQGELSQPITARSDDIFFPCVGVHAHHYIIVLIRTAGNIEVLEVGLLLEYGFQEGNRNFGGLQSVQLCGNFLVFFFRVFGKWEPGILFVIQHISNALGQILVDHTIYIDHTSLVVIDHGYRSISLIPRTFPKVVEQVVLQSFDGTLGSAPKTTINPAIKVTQLPKISLQIFDLGFGGG